MTEKTVEKAIPTMLAFRKSLSPSNIAMFGAPEMGASNAQLSPVVIREEPIRGLNATHDSLRKGKEAKPVLQVLESAHLSPADTVLVLKGCVNVVSNILTPDACNDNDYYGQHKAVVEKAVASGDLKELAKRYAMQIASASWAWRNLENAVEVVVKVKARANEHYVELADELKEELVFADLMFDVTKGYDPAQYPEHEAQLTRLADIIEIGLNPKEGFKRAVSLDIRAELLMGAGVRVYPSQEWPSDHAKEESKRKWSGGEGITRVLAKHVHNGVAQAIVNDRKASNALRTIDTWYSPDAERAIAVEPYGANSHQSVALRTSNDLHIFGIIRKVANGAELTQAQRLFYIASVIRGGVYGGKD